MPDIAGSWPEEGTQYVPGAPMEPVQQPYQPQQYAEQQYQQQQYPQQGYQDPQYAQQQYPQQQYQQQYQDQTAPQQAMYVEEEQASVPSEFDHLFRDSSPENRKSISARQPMVSGPGAVSAPGFQQQQAPAQAAQGTAVYAPPQQPSPGYEDRPGEYGGQQPFGGGGYGGQGGQGGSGGSGGRRTPLIIGGVVVVIAAVGLYLGLSGGGSAAKSPKADTSTAATHASNESAQQQAQAVYSLVQQAKQLRADINAEVGDLDSCSNVSSLQSQISSTAQSKQALAAQATKLDVSKISGGAALASALNSSWSDSASSDTDYAKAAGDVAGSCSKSAVRNDPNYQAAGQGSNQATQAKANAVKLWNQTMPSYGQPEISQSDL